MSARGSATRVVLVARRRWLAARLCEGLCLGGAVAALELALLAREGVDVARADALCMAALTGCFAALSWLAEASEGPARFARRMDRRVGADGALSTAFELERDGRPGRLGALLVARACERARAVRLVARPSLAFAALLLLGFAALAWTLERRARDPIRGEGARVDGGSAALVLERAASALERSLAAGTPEPELGARLAAALELPPPSGESAAQRAARARAIGALEAFVGDASAGASAPRLAELAGDVLEQLAPGITPATGGRPVRGPGPGASEGAEAGGGAGNAQMSPASEALALAAEGSTGTMSGSSAEPAMQNTPSGPDSTRPGGTLPESFGRWWPSSMDEVVAGYVERTRAQAGER